MARVRDSDEYWRFRLENQLIKLQNQTIVRGESDSENQNRVKK